MIKKIKATKGKLNIKINHNSFNSVFKVCIEYNFTIKTNIKSR